MSAFNPWRSDPKKQVTPEASDRNKIESALAFLGSCSQHPTTAKHRAWVIDQIARILAGHQYEEFVAHARKGKNGPHTHPWATGEEP